MIADKTPKQISTQKAFDKLQPHSGVYRVAGQRGLYVRCRATPSFFLQRRVRGQLVQQVLKAKTLPAARNEASALWTSIKPSEKSGGALRLGAAVEAYISDRGLTRKLSPRYIELMRFLLRKHLADWADRPLKDIAEDRIGLNAFRLQVLKESPGTWNQVSRLLSCVYNWASDLDESLPRWPRRIVAVVKMQARDWALSPDALRQWWSGTKEDGDGQPVATGVATLTPIKRMLWLTLLLTGARRGSVESLCWADVDLEAKILRFSVAKGGRCYSIPLSDRLAELLTEYKASDKVPPSRWCFPSSKLDGHLIKTRDDKRGVLSAHHLRHSYRTALVQLGATEDQARLLLGHALHGVSSGYVTAGLVVESLRPVSNAVAENYAKVLEW